MMLISLIQISLKNNTNTNANNTNTDLSRVSTQPKLKNNDVAESKPKLDLHVKNFISGPGTGVLAFRLESFESENMPFIVMAAQP